MKNRSFMTVLLATAALVGLWACTPTQQASTTSTVKTQLQATDDQLAAAKAAYAQQAASADPATQKAASDTLKQVQKLQGVVDQLTRALNSSTNADGTINIPAAASAAGAVLPPPWNLITMIGLPLLVGGIQELRKQKATSDGNAALAAAAKVANQGNTPGVSSTDLATHEEAVVANLSDGATAMYNAMPDFKTASDGVQSK